MRGNATAEEIAAVLAALRQRADRVATDRYAQWRATRVAALRATFPR